MNNHWVLIDTANDIYLDKFQNISSYSDTILLRNPRYSMKRLRGGISDGIDVVTIDNGRTCFEVLPTRGFSIYKIKCGNIELKWDSPNIRPVHPAFVPIADPTGLGWLEGFTEWLVRCGLESNGAPDFDQNGKLLYPIHGRIANIPADFVELNEELDAKTITLSGKVFETKLFTKKFELHTSLITQFDSTKFTIKDTITNLSAEPKEFELLYHINTGQPFASPNGRVVVPFDRLVPQTETAAENLPEWDKLGAETVGSNEVVFYFEPAIGDDGLCKSMLINAAGDRAVVLSFSRDVLPYFILWKSRLANADGYVCGLEPAINFPNTRSFEKQQGRVGKLNPSESKTFELNFEILENSEAVKQTEHELKKINTKNKIESKPIKEWSPIN
jgi:hypothetical protein